MTAFEVGGYDAAVALLAGSVPNEQLHGVDLLRDGYVFEFEVHRSNLSFIFLIRISLGELEKER